MEPISVGHSVVATWHPHETVVLQVIEELGLELHIVFNKGAVMVLPANVSKASGLHAALKEMDISPRNVVAVGDAENDHAFLRACGCSAAVANALPVVSEMADIKLRGDHGAGVRELIRRIMQEDSRILPPARRGILVGMDRAGDPVYLSLEDAALIAGNSGSGKSSLATLLTERMVEARFQFCVVDPEGDYLGLEDAVTIDSSSRAPPTESALRFLVQAGVNVVINALTLSEPEQQPLFAAVLQSICQLRARSGRPHWLLVDEAHHILSTIDHQLEPHRPVDLTATILVTVEPASLATDVLKGIDVVLALGGSASYLMTSLARRLNIRLSEYIPALSYDEALFWSPKSGLPLRVIKRNAPRQVHNRHSGKYALGDVGEWHSFYFRGPNDVVNFRARNLTEFLKISDEVDDVAWNYHLHAHDYSAWFRNVIRDDALAQTVAAIERDQSPDPRDSRKRIRDAICGRYVIPSLASPVAV